MGGVERYPVPYGAYLRRAPPDGVAERSTPAFVDNPHGLIFPPPPPPFVELPPEVRTAATAVALAAQEQIAVFFASDGHRVIDPDAPEALFETPIVPPLPEEALFFP